MTTRTRILEAAEELFAERGYHATTLREVAERVGITKPALYYHFESKSEILASLLNPLTTDLERVLTEAVGAGQSGGLPEMRRVLLTGWLDVFLRSRGALLALFRDLAAMPPELYHRLLVVLEQAVTLGAGPAAKPADQIAMAQAISAITDPVALVPHIPTEELREHLLTGVWRLIGAPPEATTPPHAETSPHDLDQPTLTQTTQTATNTSDDHPTPQPPTISHTHPTGPPDVQTDHHLAFEPRPEHSTQPTPTPTDHTHSPATSGHDQPQPTLTNISHKLAQPATPTPGHRRPTEPSPEHSLQPTPYPTGPTQSPATSGHDQPQPTPTNISHHQPATPSGTQPAQPAPASGRRGGRPKALSPAEAARVRELHASGEHTTDAIAAQLGVSRATVYRYLKT